MDIVAEVAVLALRQHAHARARAAVGRRRLDAHRQGPDEAVEAARVLEVPADPAVADLLGAEIVAPLRLLDPVVHFRSSAKAERHRPGPPSPASAATHPAQQAEAPVGAE